MVMQLALSSYVMKCLATIHKDTSCENEKENGYSKLSISCFQFLHPAVSVVAVYIYILIFLKSYQKETRKNIVLLTS